VAEGFFHDFSGWFIFMLTVGFLVLFMWVLRLLPPRQPAMINSTADDAGMAPDGRNGGEREIANPQPASEEVNTTIGATGRSNPLFAPHFLVACCLLGLTLAISLGVEFHEQIPTNRPLAEFPLTLGQWEGHRMTMEQQIIDTLDLSDYVITDFQDNEGRSVNCHVAYYQTQRKGESIHSPATCMPGGGWVFNESGKKMVPLNPGASAMPVNRAFMQKGEAKQLSYYWFPMRGRVLTDAYEMKLYNFWDALTRQRTDGALVRLITPLYGDESVASAEARLQAFMGDVVPVLDRFLPK
jgi:exosortase D (VPLPA-CTERM-specific)